MTEPEVVAGDGSTVEDVFHVPSKVIIEVQFTLDSGLGPQTGQCDVRR